MESQWNEREAEDYINKYAAMGHSSDLALRLYTSHLLGRERDLVIHGGGNTSMKASLKDVFHKEIEGIWIKGSGHDLKDIGPKGMVPLFLPHLLSLRELDDIEDEVMISEQKRAMQDPSYPVNPSVELLAHAFIPKTFIDHTHSSAILSLTNQPNGFELCSRVFGDRVAIVPYVRPGFKLARLCMDEYKKDPNIEGIILLRHGIFTFGDTAKESYDRMIDLVSVAQEALLSSTKKAPLFSATPKALGETDRSKILAWLRGGLKKDRSESSKYWVLETRSSTKYLEYAAREDIHIISQKGPTTPDHILWTKGMPLVLPAPGNFVRDDYKQVIEKKLLEYRKTYQSYFERHNARLEKKKIPLDPEPRIVIIEGIGVIAIGETAKKAKIAADIYETSIDSLTAADKYGQFTSITEKEAFEFEYWSLEQAKLGKKTLPPFAGRVCVVTGGAGVIGKATGEIFKEAGAEVVLLDVDKEALSSVASGMGASYYACDVTSQKQIDEVFTKISLEFGGMDILISNAGRAQPGAVGDLSNETLRGEFELNFFSHQMVSKAALKIFRHQGVGGQILYNISKQAVNPGPEFGAYGLPKAATLFLMRQYALDHGGDGIRANGVNADRVRSGLLTDEMIEKRAASRGVATGEYMSGNLLKAEVRAKDVGQAFLHLAQSERTTGCCLSVDGGNIAAAMR